MRDPDWDRHCTEPAVEAVSVALRREIWAELGGCPRSWREAADLYRRMGVRTLKDAVTAVLGDPVAVVEAMRGDIAMVDGALGIVRGEKIECLDRWQPLSRATCIWKASEYRS